MHDMQDPGARQRVAFALVSHISSQPSFSLTEADIAERAAIVGANEGPQSFVQIVETASFQDFGFMTFRTEYSDDQRWEKWKEVFCGADGGIGHQQGGDAIKEKLLLPIVEDPDP